MIRQCLFIIVFLLTPFWTFSQSQYISNSSVEDEDCFEDLEGDCGILLLSIHDDLVINPVNLSRKAKVFPKGQREDGLYIYYVVIDAEDTRNPKIEVSREGNVYKTELTTVVKPDYLVAYNIVEVAHPIRMDDQTQPGDLIFDKSCAELEFTTNISNLEIICSPSLKAKITSEVSMKDVNITITKVVIPISILDEARSAVEKANLNYAIHMKKLEDKTKSTSEEDWDKLEELEKQKEIAEDKYQLLTSVEIFGEGTNKLSIDIGDLKPKSKKCYAVLPLEKKVFMTESLSFKDEGHKLFAMRKYDEAKQAFEKSLNSPDLNASMRSNVMEYIDLCDSCSYYSSLVAVIIQDLMKMKKEGNATQAIVNKYASSAIMYIQKMADVNPSQYYTKWLLTMENLLKQMPLLIKYTIVEWKTLNEGNPISDVEVWAYKGKEEIPVSEYSSDRKLKNCIKKYKSFEQIGISDNNGVVELEFNRENLPKGLFFRPINDKSIKIKYSDMNTILLQSKGDFMVRQIRLKMFVK